MVIVSAIDFEEIDPSAKRIQWNTIRVKVQNSLLKHQEVISVMRVQGNVLSNSHLVYIVVHFGFSHIKSPTTALLSLLSISKHFCTAGIQSNGIKLTKLLHVNTKKSFETSETCIIPSEINNASLIV